MSKSRTEAETVPRKEVAKRYKKDSNEKIKKKPKGSSNTLIILGFIIFLIGIITAFLIYGQMWFPFIATFIVLLGVYIIYKGFTRGMSKDGKQTIILFIIFGIFLAPILFSLIQFDPLLTQSYSVSNTTGTGCSDLKTMLETDGYSTNILISSYNELQRLPDYHPVNQTLLMILGPKQFFDLFEVVSLIDFISNGGKAFFACDIGTVNEILLMQPFLSIFGAGAGGLDLVSYENGYLCQEVNGYNFDVYTSAGKIRVYRASCISSMFLGSSPPYLDAETSPNVWVDFNNNGVFDSDSENKSSYSLAYDAGNIKYYSDVELFTNNHLNAPGYDHKQFIRAIINDLTGGDPNYLILFDEKHQIKNGLHPSYLLGFLLGNVNFFQFFWALVPVGIYMAYKIANKYIPNYAKKKKKELKKKLKTKYRAKKKEKSGSVYLAKLNWFKRLGRYRDAANLLYNRLKRNLMKKLKIQSWDLQKVINSISSSHFEEENFDESRLTKNFEKLEKLASRRANISSEAEFTEIFLEMNWISKQL
ncbi:MAG: hypothetical protein EU551_02550 [Promethearchaeota archaeon]|nr:MAG: hypothetical protein EU551_02550 [Candidatus Lokiarchaeota archaeon]